MDIFTLRNRRGLVVRAIEYGAVITSIEVPDGEGGSVDVVLGFDDPAAYRDDAHHLGAVAGRYCNRIARGRFTLDGVTYHLPVNDGPNHLHGGPLGFGRRVWRAESFAGEDHAGVIFRLTSVAGDQGYPGTLEASVTYTLDERNRLAVDYHAVTDAPTPVNFTQHSYFNLAGAGRGDILGHELTLEAEAYLPVDGASIPTGEIRPVAGTPFDFRVPRSIGSRIDDPDPQLVQGGGYDHTWILDHPGDEHVAARLVDPSSGRRLEVRTTEPGLQVYTGNFLDGVSHAVRGGICLETQHFPDSPNRPSFPSTILRPGEEYWSRTVFAFAWGAQPASHSG